MTLRKSSLLVAMLAFLYPIAGKADCTQSPDCNTLGYTVNIADCDRKKPIIKCPTDLNKAFCTKATCESLGFSTDIDAINECDILERIKYCPLDNTKISCTKCGAGSILFSDKTCGTDLVSGKEAIGVIFDGNEHLAIAFDTFKGMWQQADDGPYRNKAIPNLPTYSKTDVVNDLNGKENTKLIYNYCRNTNISCLGRTAYEYTTTNTKKGDWYMASAGEAKLLYNYKNRVNTTMRRLGKNEIINSYTVSSAAEYDAWLYNSTNDLTLVSRLNDRLTFQPIIKY